MDRKRIFRSKKQAHCAINKGGQNGASMQVSERSGDFFPLRPPKAMDRRVRPFGTAATFSRAGCTFRPDAERMLQSRSPQIRRSSFAPSWAGNGCVLSGTLVEDDRREARVSMLEAYPELKSMYDPDDGNTAVFYFKDASAVFSSFTESPVTVRF